MDPFAYMLRGFSVHGGFRYDFWRLSIGAFGLVYPEFIHGAEGIDAYGSGFGFKWDARFGRDGDGFLAGVEAATGRVELRTDDNASVEIQRIFNVGVRVGWEILLPAGLYVVPWVGVGVSLGGEDTTLASNAGPREWEHQLFYVFPTIHIGWRSP